MTRSLVRHVTMSSALLTVCAALSPALSLAATAASDEVPTQRVSYAGLDLSTPVGANILYGRLKSAAGQVCGRTDSRQLLQQARWQACYDKALTDAVASVHLEQVTQIDRAKRHPSALGGQQVARNNSPTDLAKRE